MTIIYADPPWKYDTAIALSYSLKNHYPTMEFEDICALPVKDIAAKDAVLFLWSTNAHLEKAIKVINAWGFTYKSNKVWAKNIKNGLGYYFHPRHETLLLATKGNIGTPEPANRPESVLHADRRRHSQKPEEVYDDIERMYPRLSNKLELFARNTRPGWYAWGNEVANCPKLFRAA